MTLTEMFTRQGLEIQRSLRNALAQANRNASGKTSDSIDFQVGETREGVTFTVFADRHIMALQDGRKKTPEGATGDGAVFRSIKQWIVDKGIVPDDPKMSKESLAYAITKKIHREGYKGTPGLIDDVINDSLIDLIRREVADLAGNEFVKEIKVL